MKTICPWVAKSHSHAKHGECSIFQLLWAVSMVPRVVICAQTQARELVLQVQRCWGGTVDALCSHSSVNKSSRAPLLLLASLLLGTWAHRLFHPIMMINLVHFLECFKLKYWLDLTGCLPTRFRTFHSKCLNVSINIMSKRCFRKLLGILVEWLSWWFMGYDERWLQILQVTSNRNHKGNDRGGP